MSPRKSLPDSARRAAAAFFPGHALVRLDKLGEGHINDTFLVIPAGARHDKYVLQRLSPRVFKRPELVMANLRVLADHLDRRLRDDVAQHFSGWRLVFPLAARDGRDYYIDPAGNFWRMLNYIAGEMDDPLAESGRAGEAGRALGLFHRLVADLDPGCLVDILPGFHVTPGYLADYDRIAGRDGDAEEEYCAGVIDRRRAFAPILENAARDGLLPIRVIHGDPRPANIIFEVTSGKAVSMVDLDTVKPGLIHYDIGDCLRSACNRAGDDIDDLDRVGFDTGKCSELLSGYLAEMGALLTDADFRFIYPAVRLLAFELGLRFFTDHLAGDIYFKVAYRGHNLQRALAQFRLLESIEESADAIHDIIGKCGRAGGDDPW
ncbi:MAG: aminoglycoside phosphotransferase family protein [Desulfurivibrionaceae bacterium]|nr:aminoglycoside phosphotransferase family protein [Desulfurivibrionaceae bacterium]